MPEPSVSAPPSRHRIKKTIAALLVIIAGAGLGTWIALPSLFVADALSPPSLGVPRLSIAVLPFANPGGDAEQDYFAEALTEDLTADLSRIAGSFVIARSTTATYRGRDMDAKRIARELGVRYVLQGTVRRAETQVRIGVQLIDGETGQQVWSERYEKAAGDMYTFQNEVTGRIARALNLELKDALSRQAARGRPGDLDSADLALRAWAQLWTKPQSPTTNAAALTYVERALAIDPDNAEALGVQAYAYARAATYGWGEGSRVDLIRKGITAGERSIALDPKNADAVYALGFLYFIAGETARSQEMLRQCIALNRNHAPAYFFSGINLLRLGHPRDAILWIERAFALSPRDPLRSVWYGTIARARVALGEDAAAIEAANKGIAANANHSHNYAALAAALAHLGRMNEARVAIEAFKRVQPGITISRYQHNVAGDDPIAQKTYERLMSGLLKAGLPA